MSRLAGIVSKSQKISEFGLILEFATDKQFKEAARHVLHLTEKQIDELLKNGDFVEAKYEEDISK
jgi:hypothetical protein